MRILLMIDRPPKVQTALHLFCDLVPRTIEPPTVLAVLCHQGDCPPPPIESVRARACALLANRVPEARTKVRIGDPAEEIIREWRDGNYNLIIVGEPSRRRRISCFARRSLALRVVRGVSCPVVVAKGKARSLNRILLCESGIEHPQLLDRLMDNLPDIFIGGEEITVLHVMSQMGAGPGVSGKHLRSDAKTLLQQGTPEGKWLSRDLDRLSWAGTHPRAIVRHGIVVDEILKEASKGDYDLVVIGSHCRKGWQNFLLDDMARKVILHSDRPVLVVN